MSLNCVQCNNYIASESAAYYDKSRVLLWKGPFCSMGCQRTFTDYNKEKKETKAEKRTANSYSEPVYVAAYEPSAAERAHIAEQRAVLELEKEKLAAEDARERRIQAAQEAQDLKERLAELRADQRPWQAALTGKGWLVALGLPVALFVWAFVLAVIAARVPESASKLVRPIGFMAFFALLGWVVYRYCLERFRKGDATPEPPRWAIAVPLAVLVFTAAQAYRGSAEATMPLAPAPWSTTATPTVSGGLAGYLTLVPGTYQATVDREGDASYKTYTLNIKVKIKALKPLTLPTTAHPDLRLHLLDAEATPLDEFDRLLPEGDPDRLLALLKAGKGEQWLTFKQEESFFDHPDKAKQWLAIAQQAQKLELTSAETSLLRKK